jgi:hypothetical protein
MTAPALTLPQGVDMPIVEPAPWRHQYFENVPCPDNVWIPTDDPEAWMWNPRHRWVFDKLQVALSQDLSAGPHGVIPSSFPVFSKPVFNLRGMGEGSRVLSNVADYHRWYAPGHMWMPLLEGAHVSTDMAVIAGRSRWTRHATGKPGPDGTFDYWTVHAAAFPELTEILAAWVATHLGDYTGLLNIESIGNTIIEVHLRFADQWPDLYGQGWVKAIVGLYAHGTWNFADPRPRDGFSVALFVPHGRRYRHPPGPVVSEVLEMPGVSSVQITFHEDRQPGAHAMPPGGFRLALVNCWDLAIGQVTRKHLEEWFLTEGIVEDEK